MQRRETRELPPNPCWIDWQGSVVGHAAKVREEMRRPDFGHLEIRLTVDDSNAYTKPWTVTIKELETRSRSSS